MGLAVWSPGAGHGARRSGAETRGSPPWVTPLGFPQGLARSWPAASTHPEGRWWWGCCRAAPNPFGYFRACSASPRPPPKALRRQPSRRREEPSGAEAGQRCRRFESPLGAVHHGNRLKAAAVPGLRMAAAEPSRVPPSATGARSPGASPSAPPVAGPLRAAPAPAASPPRWRRLAPSCAGGGWDFRRVGIKTRGKGKGRAAPSAPRCTCCPTGGVPPGNGAPSPRLWPGA